MSIMRQLRTWLMKQLEKLLLMPDYFRALAKEWLNILFGETLVGIGFLVWWALGAPTNHALVVVFVIAMFVAGYYAWRAVHIRLIPSFEVKSYITQSTDAFDEKGQKNGWSVYFQLVPKCLTDANVEECRGFLTSIEMWDGFAGGWEEKEAEVLFLQWSHEGKTAHLDFVSCIFRPLAPSNRELHSEFFVFSSATGFIPVFSSFGIGF